MLNKSENPFGILSRVNLGHIYLVPVVESVSAFVDDRLWFCRKPINECWNLANADSVILNYNQYLEVV